ncbi:MAG: energy transducer TonB, partial [Bacteroidota bacterium]
LVLTLLMSFLIVNCSDLVNEVQLNQDANTLITEVDQRPQLIVPRDLNIDPERYLLERVYKSIKYPAIARAQDVSGSYIANFTVRKDGTIDDLKVYSFEDAPKDLNVTPEDNGRRMVIVGYGNTNITKGDSSTIDTEKADRAIRNEISRVINDLPDWEAAKVKGEAVATKMNLLFTYRLEK